MAWTRLARSWLFKDADQGSPEDRRNDTMPEDMDLCSRMCVCAICVCAFCVPDAGALVVGCFARVIVMSVWRLGSIPEECSGSSWNILECSFSVSITELPARVGKLSVRVTW